MKTNTILPTPIVLMTLWKWTRSALMMSALLLAVPGVTGCKKSAPPASNAPTVQYTCSMHPEVVKDAAGDCPKCGMKLVEKK